MIDTAIHILLVDDDVAHARLMGRACAKNSPHCQVIHVTNGDECLKRLTSEHFDVILLDYSLPRRNGLEVLAQLKALESPPPVIIVTGRGDERIAVEAMKRGASDYLVKSVDGSHLEILPWAVQRAVQGHRMQRERQQLEAQLIQSERFAAIGQLASHVAHEIRNPLSSIELNLDLLAEEIDNATGRTLPVEPSEIPPSPPLKRGVGGISGEAQELLRAIRVEVERLNGIVSEYLAFARLPRFEFEMESLNTIIHAFCKFVEPQLHQASVALKTDLAPNLPDMLLDAEQIQRALHNFLKNAIEAMPEGGEFSIETHLESNQIVLRISDAGQGILPSDLQHIYALFFTTKKGGTGLGLPLAQEIIKQHQGTIHCDSVLGQGTQFTITFPIRNE
ncbi:response regulator [Candidatus Poribacteria bacterium]|nr:response regulator [Candidatus Poribacteria bacterium]